MEAVQVPVIEGSEAWGSFLKAAVKDAHGWMPSVIAAAALRLRELAALTPQGGSSSPVQAAIGLIETDPSQWSRRLVNQLVKLMLDGLSAAGPTAGSAGRDRAGQVPARALSIVSDEAVDEEIAVARSTQAVEAEAEPVLLELAALCSSLRGLPRVSPEAYPLRPGLVARAVRNAVTELQPPARVRLALVQALTHAIARELPAVYRRHLDWMDRWGVQPTPYSVKRPPSHARAESFQTTSPAVLSTTRPSLPGHAGIASLLGQASERFDIPAEALPLLQRLQGPLERLMQTPAAAAAAAQHPAWQLLDRLLTAAAVHGELRDAQGPAGRALEAALKSIESAGPSDAGPFEAAIAAVDFRASSLLEEQADWVEREADEIRAAMDLDTLRTRLRAQIGEHLDGVGVPPAVRQFLLGAWAMALAHSATAEGTDSAQFGAQMALVDELLALFEKPVRGSRHLDIAKRLLTHARLGLVDAGWAPDAVSSELGRLKIALLEWPGRPVAAADPTRKPAATPGAVTPTSRPRLADSGFHAPSTITTAPTASTPPPPADEAEQWVETLPRGAYCRMFLLGRWMTTRLVWTNGSRTMFVFTSRHGGRVHAISRQSLRKLVDSGLAEVVQPGQFVETAVKDLASPAWAGVPSTGTPGALGRSDSSRPGAQP